MRSRTLPRRAPPWLPLALLALAGAAQAGPIFLPPAPGAALDYRVRFSHTTGDVRDGQARLTVVDTVEGPAAPAAARLLLPLPVGAAEVQVLLDDQPLAGRALTPEAAAERLAALAAATGQAGLVALTGQPLWEAETAQVGPKQILTLRFTLPAAAPQGGLARLTSPLPAAGFGAAPERITLDLSLHGAAPIRGILSPSHEVEITRDGPQSARIQARAPGGAGAFELLWAEDHDPLGLRILTHRVEGEDAGYFLLLGEPTGGDGAPPPPKDIVFALDTSGSMRGAKLEQARDALLWALDRLQPGDRFNVITFGTEVTRLAAGPVPADAAHRARAVRLVEDAQAMGRTHLSGALAAALEGPADPGRVRVVLFLTDGSPTAGEVDPERILASLPATGAPRIFPLGIGHDVSPWLLDQLAARTGGRSRYAGPDAPVDAAIAALYTSLEHPLADDLRLDLGGLAADRIHPQLQGALFQGQEILLAGRYTGGGPHTLSLAGQLGGAPRRWQVRADFPAKPQPEDAFVASLWAARRIGVLLQDLRLEGHDAAKVTEVVELSRRFGIVTEYTAFLAASGGAVDAASLARAGEQLREAGRQRSGSWAFNQAENTSALLKGKSLGSTRGYLDRQGKRQEAEVKQVGRATFYKRDGRWVAAEANEAAPKARRKVARFSPEYFELVNKNKDFARAQQLDAPVEMTVDDVTVEVY